MSENCSGHLTLAMSAILTFPTRLHGSRFGALHRIETILARKRDTWSLGLDSQRMGEWKEEVDLRCNYARLWAGRIRSGYEQNSQALCQVSRWALIHFSGRQLGTHIKQSSEFWFFNRDQ